MEPEKFLPQNVLVIVAHPDDIEFGAVGSVAKWIAAGAKVSYCIVTNGAAGSNDPTINLVELAELRREEQLAAAAKVGVSDVYFLGYQDGILEPTMELRRELTRLIRQVKPDRVVTFDPTTIFSDTTGYINHPDHVATGQAAVYAVFPSAETRPIFPELLAEGLEPHKVLDLYLFLSPHENTSIDISEYIETKLAALRCHASQLGDQEIERVKAWFAANSEDVSAGYVENFRVINRRPPE